MWSARWPPAGQRCRPGSNPREEGSPKTWAWQSQTVCSDPLRPASNCRTKLISIPHIQNSVRTTGRRKVDSDNAWKALCEQSVYWLIHWLTTLPVCSSEGCSLCKLLPVWSPWWRLAVLRPKLLIYKNSFNSVLNQRSKLLLMNRIEYVSRLPLKVKTGLVDSKCWFRNLFIYFFFKKPSCDGTLTPADNVTQPGPVRGQATAQTPKQQHQLGAVDAVPRERGQQEVV